MSEIFYQQTFHSPLGPLTLVASEQALLGAWFEGQQYELRGYENCAMRREQTEVLAAAMRWLEAYFGRGTAKYAAFGCEGNDFSGAGLAGTLDDSARADQDLWSAGPGFGQQVSPGRRRGCWEKSAIHLCPLPSGFGKRW